MSAPRLIAVGVLLAMSALACTLSERPSGEGARVGPAREAPDAAAAAPAATPTVSGDLSLARAALLRGDACYQDRAAYCITDPAFVDPILARVIERSFDGKVPTTEEEAEAVARRARGTFSNQQLDTPEARGRVEAAIRAYWDAPTITRDRGLVRADLGVPPGALERTGRAGWGVVKSPLIVDGELDGKVAASRLIALRASAPDAVTFALDVDLPASSGGFVRCEIRYQSNRDRVIVRRDDRSNQAWYTPKLGGDLSAYASGAASLNTRDLADCKLKDAIWGGDIDCVL